ncbi:hypothetical protein [uncultured Roseovarius sp.]|uniref:hypothetical protein n=1 Tax=uncultured Roseovarius sp. TaxID=293344 RepID=UPI002595F5B5|nr:hypothetical protein [uncultured Roseovarius sp.]
MLYKTGVLSDWFQYALQTKAVIGTAAANSHFVRIPTIGTISGRYPDLNFRGLPRRASPGRPVAPKVRRLWVARLWRDGTAIWLMYAHCFDQIRIWLT